MSPLSPPSSPATSTPLLVTVEFYIDGYAECNGTVECDADATDEMNCPNRFHCPAGNRVNIPSSSVCDGIVDCNEGEDEFGQDCTGRFYCPSLNNSLVGCRAVKKFIVY